ncbi:MAG: hypothetical protein IJL03_06770 [Lachnospiraceae bacterium]|nr:hypothetical protein [Lachnospiraceae bacterium]
MLFPFPLIILFIIIAISSRNDPNSRRNRSRNPYSNGGYSAQQRRRMQQQQMMQQQMLNNLRQIQRQNTGNVNPYANPYRNLQNPYTTYGNRNMTNYGNPVMPQTVVPTNTINSYGLPSAPRKRRKIVKKFSDQYGLNLTANDIEQIVSASYMNTNWAREICFMNRKYETIYEWFGTGLQWLKAYLFAFPIQQISSDFSMQEQIVFAAFDQVFSDILSRPGITVAEAIWEINAKYFTQFDESTFMIAYRFMEAKGKKYNLNVGQLVKESGDIDDLLSKYEQTGTPAR